MFTETKLEVVCTQRTATFMETFLCRNVTLNFWRYFDIIAPFMVWAKYEYTKRN